MPILRFQFLVAGSLPCNILPVFESTQFKLILDINRTIGGTAGYLSEQCMRNS